MATSNFPPPPVSHPAHAGGWLALLASTTLEGDDAVTVCATVRTDEGLSDHREYRLVVQSYDSRDGEVPAKNARPIGSIQRGVTPAELRRGVRVSFVELRPKSRGCAAAEHDELPVVVAWIERGKPDLEFDARQARPQPGSVMGVAQARRGGRDVEIALTRGDVAA